MSLLYANKQWAKKAVRSDQPPFQSRFIEKTNTLRFIQAPKGKETSNKTSFENRFYFDTKSKESADA